MAFEPSDDEIRGLVEERKPLPSDYKAKLALKPKRGHRECQLDIVGLSGSEFRLILRQALANPLDFSIILAYRVPRSNELFRLRRYNGKHGEHTNKLEKQTFYEYHVHEATARYVGSGFREDGYARPTDRYTDFHGALSCMLKDCGFDVPDDPQMNLIRMMGDNES